MSNVSIPVTDTGKKESTIAYKKRIAPIKEAIIHLGEKNMDNTVWVIRRWLKDEMGSINTPKGA